MSITNMRGLNSLIPQKKGDGDDQSVSPRESVFLIDINKIHPNPLQPRKEFDAQELKDLAASVRQFGVLQPLIVTKIEKETSTGRDVEYELIAGERRLRAAKMTSLPRVPVVIRRSTTPEKLAISVIENIQRQDLSPVEAGRAYEMLNKRFGMTNAQIAEQVGKSPSTIGLAIQILKLPEQMIQAVSDGKLSPHNAKFLTTLRSDPEKQKRLFDEIVTKNLDSYSAEKRLYEIRDEGKAAKPAMRASGVSVDPELVKFATELKEYWKMGEVKVNRFGAKTRVFIEFNSHADMEKWAKKVLRS